MHRQAVNTSRIFEQYSCTSTVIDRRKAKVLAHLSTLVRMLETRSYERALVAWREIRAIGPWFTVLYQSPE